VLNDELAFDSRGRLIGQNRLTYDRGTLWSYDQADRLSSARFAWLSCIEDPDFGHECTANSEALHAYGYDALGNRVSSRNFEWPYGHSDVSPELGQRGIGACLGR
jgi:hypothetical protein